MRPFLFPALLGSFLLLLSSSVAAQSLDIDQEVEYKRRVVLLIGEAKVISLTGDVARVTIPANSPYDATAVTSRQIVITGLSAGTALLTLFDRADRPFPILVEVVQDFSDLGEDLKKLYPQEEIQISSDGNRVIISGTVSDSRLISEIEEVALLYTDSVVNLLRPRGGQQVQLEIKFAEVSRTALREMGFSGFGFTNNADTVGGVFGPRVTPGGFLGPAPATGTPGVPGTTAGAPQGGVGGQPAVIPEGSFVGAFQLLFSSARIPLSFTLDLLRSEGLAKTLAEPTLVAMSGETAKFLAGGEFPIVTSVNQGQLQVDFKQFGILMEFTPKVYGDGVMEVKMLSEVSDVDFAVGVNLGGVTIPGITARRSQTTVRLRDGESFAIAGLLSDRVKSVIDKVPLLGDLPILGALFRSSQYRHEETELLVVITPRLVEALPSLPELPGEKLKNHPNDLEFFLFGLGLREERKAKSAATSAEGAPSTTAEEGVSALGPVPAGEIGFVH